ncbi:hypothetical protein [Gottfriedia acidiceleris]|uniref:hypothetical protein n=1 Tax=Gottfriedia acidiceleris TaxID=371036 RepID=UPI002FFEACE5
MKSFEFGKIYTGLTTKINSINDVNITLGKSIGKSPIRNKNVKEVINQPELGSNSLRMLNERIALIGNATQFDQQSKVLKFEVNERHAILNGGHSYNVLKVYDVDKAISKPNQ